MSSRDRVPSPPKSLRLALLAAVLAALPACTVSPLYATSSTIAPGGAPRTTIADVRGRVSVQVANDRTSQVFRNALLFQLNGGAKPVTPLYEVRYVVKGQENVVAIQKGSGIPSASAYRLAVSYQLIRLADTKVIATGSRFGTAPFDRTRQLFASSRAVLDARNQAGMEAAERVNLAVTAAIDRDLRIPAAASEPRPVAR